MSERTDALISSLAFDLRPVRRLHTPPMRAAAWCAAVLGLGFIMTPLANVAAMTLRLSEAPDLRWAMFGGVVTAWCAAVAAFEMSVPGRSRFWALLPVPGALLWLGASGVGCLRNWVVPGVLPATLHDAMTCITFITLVSVPLSALLVWMLLRACPLWPAGITAMGGLAAAAAAASLLTLFHPHDASAVDLLMHVVAVLVVIGGTRWAGMRAARR